METTKPNAANAQAEGATGTTRASASSSTNAGRHGSATTADGLGQLTEKALAILDKRLIDLELAVRLGWKSSAKTGDGDWIEIPYFQNGRHVNTKHRTLSGEKRFHQEAGGVKCLYNVDCIKDLGDHPLVITEGEMDCMIALQCGYMAVSVPDGAPAKAIGDGETRKYEYLADIPSSVKRIILLTDADNPGAALLHDLAIRLGKHRCMWVTYPKNCKDLNDTMIAYGEKGVQEVFKRAQFMKVTGLSLLSELPPLAFHDALSINIDFMDEHLKLRRGDLSVVTGIPSHGKSTFVNHMAFNMARHHNWHVTFASFEQPPQTEHAKALKTLYAGRPSYLLNRDELQPINQWIDQRFSFITPDDLGDEECGLAWLLERAAAAVTRYNATMIVIDPWNEMDHLFDQREMTMTQYVGFAIKELKRFARAYQVHMMVVAHPTKLRKDSDGKYPIPTLYDVSDSQHWYNKPDQGIVVYRNEDHTLIRVAKSRYHQTLGKPGDIKLTFSDHDYQFRGYHG